MRNTVIQNRSYFFSSNFKQRIRAILSHLAYEGLEIDSRDPYHHTSSSSHELFFNQIFRLGSSQMLVRWLTKH